jgi:uncharacterized protein YecE (DUF72 family)
VSELWVGTSGYVYVHWRHGVFYPEGLRQREELTYYAQHFRTVELNNPFYRLPAVESFDRWRDAVPDDFLYAVKASRYITHIRRLRDAADSVALFLERAERLGPRLGPILFQLPPTYGMDLPVLRRFLDRLPQGRHWVVEFRHPSWHTAEVYDALADRAVALCIPVGGRVRPDLVTTAPFVYVRMHAGEGAGGGFTGDQLRYWASQLRALGKAGKERFVYFNNDAGGHAPRDARTLLDLLRIAR